MQYPNIAQPQYAFAPTMMAEGGKVQAENVRAKGRGEDTMLVHMTPGEVGGLQALAMQHGGSLSINPKTGLPEAGFLKNILPTVLGVALTPFMGPMAAGLTVGGLETVRTGDLGRGLMAGLGAYGGANLAGGLTQAATQPAQQAAMANVAAEQAANQNVLAGLGSDTGFMELGPLPGSEAGTQQIMNAYTQNVPQTIGQQYSAIGQGAQNLFASGDTGSAARTAFMDKLGGPKEVFQTAGFAAAPMIVDALTPQPLPLPEEEKSNYAGPYTPTKRTVRYPTEEERRRMGTGEFTYFTPSNPVPFAEGGDVGSAPSITPAEAQVYSQIANVQRLAGLPAIDTSRFSVAPKVDRSGLVYNPVQPRATGETNYGFKSLAGEIKPTNADAALLQFFEPEGPSYFSDSGYKMMYGKDRKYTPYTPQDRVDMSEYEYDPKLGGYVKKASPFGFNKGGSVPQLENGGFVLTKKAVDGLGKGDNKRGQQVASRGLGAIPIKGPGTGTSDSIPTSIEGKRPARVSNGEAYVPKKQVAKHGGAKKFYALMKKAERRA